MRTTVTLDPDVAAKLKETARESGISFKQALNSAVRQSFERGEVKVKPKPYQVRPRNLGVRPGVNLVKALQLAGELEDAETIRKMRMGK